MVLKLSTKAVNPEFKQWLERVTAIGSSYEIIIEDGEIVRVYVREGDDGNWANIGHGRVFGTKVLSFKQRVFFPRIVDGKFIADYNGK